MELIGKNFGRWTILEKREQNNHRQQMWLCKCDCGTEREVVQPNLVNGKSKSCGCVYEITADSMEKKIKKMSEYISEDMIENTRISMLQQKDSSNNTSGFRGVYKNKKDGKWKAQIGFKKKMIHLGTFEKFSDAKVARKEAEEKYYKPLLVKQDNDKKIMDKRIKKVGDIEGVEKKLLNKSIEAFVMGVEIYNKPTIKYRVEGFSFFICNAWELMLKSHLIKIQGEKSIYYNDNLERTISLEKCVKMIFTNDKDPLRLNLEKIIELRNTSTHFITEEYEMIYITLFQSCVINFSEKIFEFHDYDITKVIPQNFLTLSISMKALEETSIIAKYPEEIANKILAVSDELAELSMENNQKFALRIEHHHFITKDKNKATSVVKIDKRAESHVTILKELQDPNNTHPYNAKACIKSIMARLKKSGIDLKFNMYIFGLFVTYYGLKDQESYCFSYRTGQSSLYTYSQQTIDLIVEEIKKDPENIVLNLKKKLKK